MKSGALRFVALAALWTWGCALPVRSGRGGAFVTDRELAVASLSDRAFAEFKSGRFERAEVLFAHALAAAPESRPLRRNLAVARTRSGAAEEAVSDLTGLVAEDPESPVLRVELAEAYAATGDYGRALVTYEEALRLALVLGDEPLETVAVRRLSELAFKSGDEERAVCYSVSALGRSPGAPDLERHARLLNAVGVYEAAERAVGGRLPEAALSGEARLAHTLSLSAYARGDRKSYESRETTAWADAAGDPVLSLEIRLLSEKTGLTLPEREGDEEEAPTADESSDAVTGWSLYWPAPVAALLPAEEPAEETDGGPSR